MVCSVAQLDQVRFWLRLLVTLRLLEAFRLGHDIQRAVSGSGEHAADVGTGGAESEKDQRTGEGNGDDQPGGPGDGAKNQIGQKDQDTDESERPSGPVAQH